MCNLKIDLRIRAEITDIDRYSCRPVRFIECRQYIIIVQHFQINSNKAVTCNQLRMMKDYT